MFEKMLNLLLLTGAVLSVGVVLLMLAMFGYQTGNMATVGLCGVMFVCMTWAAFVLFIDWANQ
ncbi:hypothetical protein UFOVP70_19 [uncultured Caudovirales phage]|uniref:Uncharacterized protein n=1 Tax=uncultured Caudovirales phage TaxID=2100421 RepID=A0A6J5KYF2_9CAUD|nr:hypothetical protein UFOVP70_19 [uncultured Caudovirales phage]